MLRFRAGLASPISPFLTTHNRSALLGGPGLDVPQALPVGVGEGQAEKLVPAGEGLELVVPVVPVDTRLERVHGHEVHQLGKDRAASVHGPSPLVKMREYGPRQVDCAIRNRKIGAYAESSAPSSGFVTPAIQRWDGNDFRNKINTRLRNLKLVMLIVLQIALLYLKTMTLSNNS